MPRPRGPLGEKNASGKQIKALRARDRLSQRDLAHRLQLAGLDMDKNAITRIETGKRCVTDLELMALARIFDVSYDLLIHGEAP